MRMTKPTRRHVKGRTTAIIRSNSFSSSKSEISKFDSVSSVGDQNILGFQIAMVNATGMTEIDSVQNLKENGFDQAVISDVLSPLSYVREEVALWAVFKHDIGAIVCVENLDKLNNILVEACAVVKINLSLLESLLARLQANLVQCLDSIGSARRYVDSSVNNSICAYTQHTSYLQPIAEDLPDAVFRRAEVIESW